ncbi:restriction endonuclease subunit S [Kaistella solincola]|uniref:restriction endonuclease subunit S n=1 Tax=Kaistella solincola TaxID=510955 RepID=UPI000690F5B1|nr:restriction endonuclease subunit S [Kaistella solincola]
MNKSFSIYEIADLNRSSLTSRDNYEYINYLDTSNLTRNKIENIQYLDTNFPSRAKRKVKADTILYSTVRPNQEHFGIVENTNINNLIVSTGFTTIDVKSNEINPKYLYYKLTNPVVTSYLQTIAENSVSAYPSIKPEEIGNLRFKFPVLKVQQKIAKVLSALDDKIELNNQINAELEEMAKTLYDYWFVQFDFPFDCAQGKPFDFGPIASAQGPASQNGTVAEEHATIGDRHAPVAERHAPVADGYSPVAAEHAPVADQPLPVAERSRTVAERSRGYKSSGGKMVYNEVLKREIPEGWEVKRLHEIANITMGQSPSGESYNEQKGGMIFFQGSTDFGWRFPENRIYTTSPTRFAKENDILLSVRAPIGTMNIAMYDCCIGRGLSALNSKENYNSFLIYQMNYFKKKFDYLNSVGTTFGSLTKDDLYNLELCYPNKHILEKFEKIVSKFDAKIKINTKQNQELAQLRDWLLPMLMNGQVTVASGEYEMEEGSLGMVAEEDENY